MSMALYIHAKAKSHTLMLSHHKKNHTHMGALLLDQGKDAEQNKSDRSNKRQARQRVEHIERVVKQVIRDIRLPCGRRLFFFTSPSLLMTRLIVRSAGNDNPSFFSSHLMAETPIWA
jgi:hypothetical protein